MKQSLLRCVPSHEWGFMPCSTDTATSGAQPLSLSPPQSVESHGRGSFGDVVAVRSTLYPEHACAMKVFSHIRFTDAEIDDALDDVLAAAAEGGVMPVSRSDSRLTKICREAVLLWQLRDASDRPPETATQRLGSRHVLAYYGLFTGQPSEFQDALWPLAALPRASAPRTVSVLTECLYGGTLPDFVSRVVRRTRVPIPSVYLTVWLSQALQALAYLHGTHRHLHRDVKPANMMMRLPFPSVPGRDLEASELVMIDFGESVPIAAGRDRTGAGDEDDNAAAAAETFDPFLTNAATHTVVGTQGYCAPELATMWGCHSRGSYGPAADLWSLAASFYVLLVQGPAACAHGMASLLRASAFQRHPAVGGGGSCEENEHEGSDAVDGSESTRTSSVVSAHVATLLTASGAYPTLQSLFYVSRAPAVEASPVVAPAAVVAERTSGARAWSWVTPSDGTTSTDAMATQQTFFDDDTVYQTAATNPLSGLLLHACGSASLSTPSPGTSSSSSSSEALAQRWGQQMLAIERMAAHLAAHHGGARDDDREDNAREDRPSRAAASSLHVPQRASLEVVQRRLSHAFVSVVDGLMHPDPHQRLSVRHALEAFASLCAFCGPVTCSPPHAPRSSESDTPLWSDRSFVMALVLAHHRPLALSPLTASVHALRGGAGDESHACDVSCTAVWFRSLATADAHTAQSVLERHLEAHSPGPLDTSAVLLITIEWLESDDTIAQDVDSEDDSTRGTDVVDARQKQLAMALGLLAWRGGTGDWATPPSQTLLSTAARVTSLAQGQPCAGEGEECARLPAECAPHAAGALHCACHFLYGLPQLSPGLTHPVSELSVLHLLATRCADAQRALSVAFPDTRATESRVALLERVVVAGWCAQLKAATHFLRCRLAALRADGMTTETSGPDDDVTAVQLGRRANVFYLVPPPTSQNLLDELLRRACSSVIPEDAQQQQLQDVVKVEAAVSTLETFVHEWLVRAPYVVTVPC